MQVQRFPMLAHEAYEVLLQDAWVKISTTFFWRITHPISHNFKKSLQAPDKVPVLQWLSQKCSQKNPKQKKKKKQKKEATNK